MWDDRLIIPRQFRPKILKQLHKTHPGIERMKSIARSHVYWPNIDGEIRQYVQECNLCAEAVKTPVRVPLAPWPMPPAPCTEKKNQLILPTGSIDSTKQLK